MQCLLDLGQVGENDTVQAAKLATPGSRGSTDENESSLPRGEDMPAIAAAAAAPVDAQ